MHMAAAISQRGCPCRKDIVDPDDAYSSEERDGDAAAGIPRFFSERSSGLKADEVQDPPEEADTEARKTSQRICRVERRK